MPPAHPFPAALWPVSCTTTDPAAAPILTQAGIWDGEEKPLGLPLGSRRDPVHPPWPPHHPRCPAAPRAAASPSPSKTNWRPARSLCLDRNVPSDSFLKQKPSVDIERGVIADTAGRGCTCWYKSHAAAQPAPAEPYRGQRCRRRHEAPLLPLRALPRPGQWLEEVRGGPQGAGVLTEGLQYHHLAGQGLMGRAEPPPCRHTGLCGAAAVGPSLWAPPSLG